MPGRGAYGSSALTPPQIISRGELFLHTLGLSEGGGELLGGNYYWQGVFSFIREKQKENVGGIIQTGLGLSEGGIIRGGGNYSGPGELFGWV